MKFRILLLLTLALAIAAQSFAQTTVADTPDEKKEKLRTAAVAFLRETYGEIGNMRSLENRISFTAEIAALLWYHDQREGAAMFGRAVSDFKYLLATYDSQMNSFAPAAGDEPTGMMGMFMGESTDRSKIARKFSTALGVRQQLAMSIAEHEPDLAYNFFHDSTSTITNPEFRKQMEASNDRYEPQLIAMIAQTNVKKGVELSTRSLSGGVRVPHVEFLKQVHARDPEAAKGYAESLLSKLKETSIEKAESFPARLLLEFGDSLRAEQNAKAVYSAAQLGEIADIYARMLLNANVDEDTAIPDTSLIEKYSPGRAAQVKAKYTPKGNTRNPNRYTAIGAPPPPSVYRGPVNVASSSGSAPAISGSDGPEANEETQQQRAEREAMEGLAKLGDKELPKEERERIVAQARELLSKSTGREKKITGLSMLASTVAKAGDKQLASEIMREAAGLVGPNPKNYQDFMFRLMVGAGYAEVDPEQAFPIFDDTIFRANELINAVVKLAEFADVNEEIIADGEFQVGAFGGQMIRGFTGSVGMADGVLKQLIDADFEKTKALTNRFDRPEVRVLAKMLLLRSVLGPDKAKMEGADLGAEDLDIEDTPPAPGRR